MVTVVDDDVDIRSASDVEWAMATRLNPQTGITVIENIFGHGLNRASRLYRPQGRLRRLPPLPFRYEHDRAFTKKIALEALEIASRPIEPAKAAAPAAPKPAKSRKSVAAPSGGQAM